MSAGGAGPVAPLGLAVDLGTTTVAGTLVRMADGTTLVSGSEVNQQVESGADALSRAAWAHGEDGGTRELQRLAVASLNQLVEKLCQEAGAKAEEIGEVVVAGNAIMLHLLLGEDPHSLAVTPSRPVFTESREVEPGGLAVHPRGRVVTFPLIGTRTGGDTVAGIHAAELLRGEGPRLLVDLGTDTEVALGVGGRVVVASAPAGTSFEGGRVGVGMPAVAGAVVGVRLGEEVELDVLGGGEPGGLSGTGLVSLLAELRRTGLVDVWGRLASAFEVEGHPVASHLEMAEFMRSFRVAEGLILTQRGLREVQSAISAVRAAVTVVLEESGVEPEELEAVYLAGPYGPALTEEAARGVGLVPRLPAGVMQGVGNVVLEGTRLALASTEERNAAFQIPAHTEYLELSGHDRFSDLFLDGMAFPEWED